MVPFCYFPFPFYGWQVSSILRFLLAGWGPHPGLTGGLPISTVILDGLGAVFSYQSICLAIPKFRAVRLLDILELTAVGPKPLSQCVESSGPMSECVWKR
jgi:hypothetical protein